MYEDQHISSQHSRDVLSFSSKLSVTVEYPIFHGNCFNLRRGNRRKVYSYHNYCAYWFESWFIIIDVRIGLSLVHIHIMWCTCHTRLFVYLYIAIYVLLYKTKWNSYFWILRCGISLISWKGKFDSFYFMRKFCLPRAELKFAFTKSEENFLRQ